MVVGIISDTHDNVQMVDKAIELFKQKNVQKIIFAGDLVSPFVVDHFAKALISVIAVFGNNEGEKVFITKKFQHIGEIYDAAAHFELDNKHFFLTHYHWIAEHLFEHGDDDYVIFGHTHKIDIREKNDRLLINPGECCGILTGQPSVVTLDTATNQYELHYLR